MTVATTSVGSCHAAQDTAWAIARVRETVLRRDGYLCQCPLCQGGALPLLADEVDYIIPLARGGSNHMDNLQAINHILFTPPR